MLIPGQANVINRDSLRPYISLVFLECEPGQQERAFAEVAAFLRAERKHRSGTADSLVGAEIDEVSGFLRAGPDGHGLDQASGFVHRIEANPSWAVPGASYTDVRHAFSLVLRRGRIFAVHCDARTRDALGRWLTRKPPRPAVRRVSQTVVQGAFLRGEAKGIWLHGTHMRSALRPDTKYLTGTAVADMLSPLEDTSYAMAAARAELPDDGGLTALLGVVGTSPRKGMIWNRQSQDFADFLTASTEAIELVEEVRTGDKPLSRPFPILAVEVDDLSAVRGAYDILTRSPDDLLISLEVDDELRQAADILQRATLTVEPTPDSPDFRLLVDVNGARHGTLQAVVRMHDDAAVITFRHDPGSSTANPGLLRDILWALEHDDLFAVYYDTGHVISRQGIWQHNPSPAPFPNWEFRDFSGFDLRREKPADDPKKIHELTGASGDRSLFGWVVRNYSSGWLICDDRPGEVADFIHISRDFVLSLIHVKGAHADSPARQVAIKPFEEVAGQAVKNSNWLTNLEYLKDSLMHIGPGGRAAWTDGRRVRDRAEFHAALGKIGRSDRRVVIVQPHMSELLHRRAMADTGAEEDAGSVQLLRLRSLETLLNSARYAAVTAGADLYVIGSLR